MAALEQSVQAARDSRGDNADGEHATVYDLDTSAKKKTAAKKQPAKKTASKKTAAKKTTVKQPAKKTSGRKPRSA